jgi:threonine dehydrogenase-like Zn-dependent dehydrogenase
VVEPDELARAIRSATGSFMLGDGSLGQLTGGISTVIDCVGSEASIAQALSVVAPGGEIVLVGMPGHTSLDLTSLWHRESRLRGCYAYDHDDFAQATALVAAADLGRLVSATYPLSRYRQAIEHAATAGPRGSVKIAFDLRNERERNR